MEQLNTLSASLVCKNWHSAPETVPRMSLEPTAMDQE